MAPDEFYEEKGSRLLTPDAFELGLDSELKRAVRSQSFLTLVVLETSREWNGITVTADDGTMQEVAEIVGHEMRDTDLLSYSGNGVLSLVLLDADCENSTKMIDRLVQRLDAYDFPTPLRVSIGAACYPTDAVDGGSLKHQAITHPVVNWRGGSPEARTHR
jgi:GGDEF domain-containing protein